MKRKQLFRKITALLIALLLLAAFTLSAAAAPDAGEGDQPDTSIGGDEPADNPAENDTPGDEPAAVEPTDDPQQTTEPPEEEPEEQPTEEPDEEQSRYTEPPYLDELPKLEDGEAVPATSVPVPVATVSDASLLSGIVMWLCVAVGIAVVVGVMVSKRTRRRGG